MNLLAHSPFLDILGSALLHFIWQGTLIAIVFAILLKVLPGSFARLRYSIGMAWLLFMLVLPSMTVWQGYSTFRSVEHVTHERLFEESLNGVETALNPESGEEQSSQRNIASVTQDQQSEYSLWLALRQWLGIGWMIGVVLMGLRFSFGWIDVSRRKVRYGEPVPKELQVCFNQLMRRVGIRRQVMLKQTSAFSEAVLIGWIKPMVLLPVSVVSEMSIDHIEAIIAHELAHVKRHDYLMAGIQVVVETLLFYHPAVWWVSRQVRIEREHCCDDLAAEVLEDTPRYARALYELELNRNTFGRYALSVEDGPLASRIRRLAAQSGRKKVKATPPMGVRSLVAITVAVSTLIFGSCADFNSDIVSIGEEYELPPRLASMVATNDRGGVVTYLHDAHNSGKEETLKLVAGVYDRAEEDIRRSLMFVLAHINTKEADQILIQMAEADPSEEVRHGALRAITVRSEAVGLLQEEKVANGEVHTSSDIVSDYSYPVMLQDQEEALASSLRRIVLDDEQAPKVRLEAYRVLEPMDGPGTFADDAITQSLDFAFKMSLILYLNYPEHYRAELVQIYHNAPDVETQSDALSVLANMGAMDMIPNILDLLFDITHEELQWQVNSLKRLARNVQAPRSYWKRGSMKWALETLYIDANESEKVIIAETIDHELIPRLDKIEADIEDGLKTEIDRRLILHQLQMMTFLTPSRMVNGVTIKQMNIPSQQRAKELLRRLDPTSPIFERE